LDVCVFKDRDVIDFIELYRVVFSETKYRKCR
jgi:hypothetical protein